MKKAERLAVRARIGEIIMNIQRDGNGQVLRLGAGRGRQGSMRFNWRCNSRDADMAPNRHGYPGVDSLRHRLCRDTQRHAHRN